MQHTHKNKNDIYGILMDAIHFQIDKYREDNDTRGVVTVKLIIWVVEKTGNFLIEAYEFRNENKHFYIFKTLCWVVL